MDVLAQRDRYLQDVRIDKEAIARPLADKIGRAAARNRGAGKIRKTTAWKSVSEDLAWDYVLTGVTYGLFWIVLDRFSVFGFGFSDCVWIVLDCCVGFYYLIDEFTEDELGFWKGLYVETKLEGERDANTATNAAAQTQRQLRAVEQANEELQQRNTHLQREVERLQKELTEERARTENKKGNFSFLFSVTTVSLLSVSVR